MSLSCPAFYSRVEARRSDDCRALNQPGPSLGGYGTSEAWGDLASVHWQRLPLFRCSLAVSCPNGCGQQERVTWISNDVAWACLRDRHFAECTGAAAPPKTVRKKKRGTACRAPTRRVMFNWQAAAEVCCASGAKARPSPQDKTFARLKPPHPALLASLSDPRSGSGPRRRRAGCSATFGSSRLQGIASRGNRPGRSEAKCGPGTERPRLLRAPWRRNCAFPR